MPSCFSKGCVTSAPSRMGLPVLTVSETMLFYDWLSLPNTDLKTQTQHCSICIILFIVSVCALKSLNRLLPRHLFRMGRWTRRPTLDPQNCYWLRGPGSLAGRSIFKCDLSVYTRLTSPYSYTYGSALCFSSTSSLPPPTFPPLKLLLIHIPEHIFEHDNLIPLLMNMNDFCASCSTRVREKSGFQFLFSPTSVSCLKIEGVLKSIVISQ